MSIPLLPVKTSSPTRQPAELLTGSQRDWLMQIEPQLFREVWPGYLQRSETGEVPPDLRRGLFNSFAGLMIPRQYGGLFMDSPDDRDGINHVTAALLTEELSTATQCGLSVDVGASAYFGGGGIRLYGTPDQKDRWLPGLATGEFIAALALTESDSGSDAFRSLKTTYRKVGSDEFVLNGTKEWSSNGAHATHVLVVARDEADPDNRHAATVFVVHTKADGFSATSVHKSMIRASNTGSLAFNDVKVTRDDMLGPEGLGGLVLLDILTLGRTVVPGKSVGGMRAALDVTLPYAKERTSFGKPIYKHSGVAGLIGSSLEMLKASRLLVLNAAHALDLDYGRQVSNPGRIPPWISNQASLAKGFASSQVRGVIGNCIQVCASAGVDAVSPLPRLLTDSLIDGIFEGTTEIQRNNTTRHAVEEGIV